MVDTRTTAVIEEWNSRVVATTNGRDEESLVIDSID